MIKIVKLFLCLFFFCLIITGPLKSENLPIVYVDVQKILNESTVGKKVQNSISTKISKNLKVFEKKEEELKSQESEILNQKNILSKEEFDIKVGKFKEEVKNFSNKKKNFDTEIKSEKIKTANMMVLKLNQILANYAAEKSIGLVFQKKNIIIGKSELDITKNILKIFNEQVKSIN